jgi:hypothetical protein
MEHDKACTSVNHDTMALAYDSLGCGRRVPLESAFPVVREGVATTTSSYDGRVEPADLPPEELSLE